MTRKLFYWLCVLVKIPTLRNACLCLSPPEESWLQQRKETLSSDRNHPLLSSDFDCPTKARLLQGQASPTIPDAGVSHQHHQRSNLSLAISRARCRRAAPRLPAKNPWQPCRLDRVGWFTPPAKHGRPQQALHSAQPRVPRRCPATVPIAEPLPITEPLPTALSSFRRSTRSTHCRGKVAAQPR